MNNIDPEHYHHEIQPIQFIMANKIPYAEGCALKYIVRHKQKNGAEDILKAIRYLQFILELDYGLSPDEHV